MVVVVLRLEPTISDFDLKIKQTIFVSSDYVQAMLSKEINYALSHLQHLALGLYDRHKYFTLYK